MNLCFSTLGCTESSMDEIIATAERFGICGLEIRGVGGRYEKRSHSRLCSGCYC